MTISRTYPNLAIEADLQDVKLLILGIVINSLDLRSVEEFPKLQRLVP